MEVLLFPISVFVGLGIFAGVILTIASKKLAVPPNPKVEKLKEQLPNINCGACGFTGCEGYAESLADPSANVAPNLCKPGGEKTALGIGQVLGIEVSFDKEVAYVACSGLNGQVKEKYHYTGTQSCRSVSKYYNGIKSCSWGCDGFGDCISECDFGAISLSNGIAVINPNKCTACGKCVKSCPHGLIHLRKYSQHIQVLCSSCDTAKATVANCKVGCIACSLCVKKCPSNAITITDNHARIDQALCTNCGACIDACKRGIIRKI